MAAAYWPHFLSQELNKLVSQGLSAVAVTGAVSWDHGHSYSPKKHKIWTRVTHRA